MSRVSDVSPLSGLRVVEFCGIGPGPHCAMLLSDLGAEVLRIDRPGGNGWTNRIVDRGRATLEVDIRNEEGRDKAISACEKADVLIEGFRPGVMERLGLGPDELLARNPRLVYGRMTGWGQDGPLAKSAGHDINYISLGGALAAMGKPGEPAAIPLNLVGDFGGGSMFLVMGLLAALYERERSGQGQVVDAAIVDGVNSLMTMFTGLVASGQNSVDREKNLLGGAAHFYRCYLCSDGREISVGAIEPHFYEELMTRIDAPDALRSGQYDQASWPEKSAMLAALFAKRPSTEWAELLENSDACAVRVLTVDEAPDHPHMKARNAFVTHEGLLQSAPAPRFSRTPPAIQPTRQGEDMLAEWLTS